MVVGVSTGYKKVMELVGTGYRASVTGKDLTLNVGYCVPQIVPIPEGVKVTVSAAEAQRHRVAAASSTTERLSQDRLVIPDGADRMQRWAAGSSSCHSGCA